MADVVTKHKRSEMMSNIRSSNTRPEVLIRKALFARGYRYRKNVKTLPGKPDIYLPKYKAVIQVHGCFWHRHNCHLFKLPSTRTDFWIKKFAVNKANDQKAKLASISLGLRQLIVWECAIKGKQKRDIDELINELEDWLTNQTCRDKEIAGKLMKLDATLQV